MSFALVHIRFVTRDTRRSRCCCVVATACVRHAARHPRGVGLVNIWHAARLIRVLVRRAAESRGTVSLKCTARATAAARVSHEDRRKSFEFPTPNVTAMRKWHFNQFAPCTRTCRSSARIGININIQMRERCTSSGINLAVIMSGLLTTNTACRLLHSIIRVR